METQPFIVKALQNYKSKGKEELGFKKGDLITVSVTNEEAMQYYGECSGKSGWFPYFYVKSIGVGVAGGASTQGQAGDAARGECAVSNQLNRRY